MATCIFHQISINKYIFKFLANKYKVSKTYPNSRLSSPFEPQVQSFLLSFSSTTSKPGHGWTDELLGHTVQKLGFGAGHSYSIWRELQISTNLEDKWVPLVAIQYMVSLFTSYLGNIAVDAVLKLKGTDVMILRHYI